MRVVKLCMLPAAAMMREVSAHAEILWATKKRCGYVQRLKHMNSANWPPLYRLPPIIRLAVGLLSLLHWQSLFQATGVPVVGAAMESELAFFTMGMLIIGRVLVSLQWAITTC